MAVSNLQGPGQAGSLNVTGTTEGDRRVGRLAGSREKRLGIDTLTDTPGTPGIIVSPLVEGPKQSRVSPCGGNLVRAWHSRPSHLPTSPVGPDLFSGEHGFAFAAAGAVFYRTIGARDKWPNGGCGKIGRSIAPEPLKRA
ncbi:hypothetical protein GCM10023322_22910 [Rugosimonospora acidiphila]|uniref:Uncharacterized protein n=1 Tax=Rugosimonospora acidiphila TaxID=556531 RepID=A0ABP9RQD5_9ACTN